MLSNDSMAVRVSGILLLERMSQDDSSYRAMSVRLLTRFVEERVGRSFFDPDTLEAINVIEYLKNTDGST